MVANLQSKNGSHFNKVVLEGQFKVGFIMIKSDYCSDSERKTVPK